MGQTTDGISSTPSQHGAKQVSYPLQQVGNYYARSIRRNMILTPASAYNPIVGDRTTYVNRLTYSEEFDNAAWTKTNLTVSANAVANPGDGTVTADSLLETVTNGAHEASQAFTFSATAYTANIMVKANGRTVVWLIANDGSTTYSGKFDISAGTVSAVSNATGSIKKIIGDWYNCIITFTPASGTGYLKLTIDNGSGTSYAGDITKGVYAFGAQLITSSSAGPYISTTSVTRSASCPTVDQDDPFAFIVFEQEPDAGALELGVARWGRRYANVPSATSEPSSITLSKPSIAGTFPQAFGSYRIFQPDSTLQEFDVYPYQAVTSDSGPASSDGYPTGGTYTLSFGGSTTGSLSYSATAGALQTALNGLTPISNRGNVTVSGTYNSASGFSVTFASYTQITLGSFTGTGSHIDTQTNSNGGYSQIVGSRASAANISGDPSGLGWSGGIPAGGGATIDGNADGTSSTSYRDYRITNGSSNCVSGTYTLTVMGQTTGTIQYNASFSDVQTALNALGIGTFTVSAPYDGRSQPLASSGVADIMARITYTNVSMTAGTVVFNAFGSSTSAISVSASAATVQTALNGLTPVSNRGNCSVSGNLRDGFSITFSNALITDDDASLTPTGATATVATTDGGINRTQRITFSAGPTVTRTLYAASHGFATSDNLYAKIASSYFTISSGTFTLPDASTVLIGSGSAYTASGTATEIGKRTKQGYAPGSATVRTTETTTYYLPGVTPGIATAVDIPIPENQSETATFLQAIFAGTGSINYAVGQLQRYDGPILQLTTTTVQASDL